MTQLRLVFLVSVAMLAFAGNSVLCRLALKHTTIDAASFTSLRLLSGACALWLLVLWQRRVDEQMAPKALAPDAGSPPAIAGSWLSALALFVYAAGFSFAYVSMSAATGALLLFGAVQVTMVGHGLYRGERLQALQKLGFLLALGGLVALMLPGLATPSLLASLAMLMAGAAWGIYSLRGKALQKPGAPSPTAVTAGNFIRAVPITLLLSLLMMGRATFDANGVLLALASGALASGVGYAIWYRVLPALASTQAATVQLSVPVIAALGGVALIGEALTLPMVASSAAVLGGIALVILNKK